MKFKDRLIGILQLFICVAIPGTIYSSFKFSGHPLGGLETLVLYAPFVCFYLHAEFKRKQLKSFQVPKDESIPITPEMLAVSASDDAPETEGPMTHEERLKDIDACLQKAISDCAQGKISAKEFADICTILRQAENKTSVSPPKPEIRCQHHIENNDGIRIQNSSDKFVEHRTSNYNRLHISPDIYTQAVREKLDADPYNPAYHKGKRNPYTNTIITCEDDYMEYIGTFVYDRLIAEKHAPDRIGPDHKSPKSTSISAEKPARYTPPRDSYADRAPIPWWRNGRFMANFASVLLVITVILGLIYTIAPSLFGSTAPAATSPSRPPTISANPSPSPNESLSIQERLDLMRQAGNNNNKPLPRPSNGWIAYSSYHYGERIAPLTINAHSLTADFYIKLRRPDTKAEVISFYVHGNTQETVDVPLGLFEILYASGSDWYGATQLFGPETRYFLFDELFNFYEEDDYINGWTITLEKQSTGNLDSKQIFADEFFTG